MSVWFVISIVVHECVCVSSKCVFYAFVLYAGMSTLLFSRFLV